MESQTATQMIAHGFAASLAAGLATGVGALPVFLREQWSERQQALMLALAAGVMLGATVFSLVVPALGVATEQTGSEAAAVAVVAVGLVLGALAVWTIHASVPHQHFVKGVEGGAGFDLGRNWLFVLAITLHNVPEGMSVGVAFGNGVAAGTAVGLGIGLQNLPEGLAVAAALIADGFDRRRAFLVAFATGLVEPAGGLLGAATVSLSDGLLPWGLAFAGGAMLFVISGEVIPETHRAGRERAATFTLVAGFVLMMVLDVMLD